MKREISELFGEPYARLAIMLNDARGWAKGNLPTYQDRKEFFEGIVNGDPDPVELVREGREAEVLELIEQAKGRTVAAPAARARERSRSASRQVRHRQCLPRAEDDGLTVIDTAIPKTTKKSLAAAREAGAPDQAHRPRRTPTAITSDRSTSSPARSSTPRF